MDIEKAKSEFAAILKEMANKYLNIEEAVTHCRNKLSPQLREVLRADWERTAILEGIYRFRHSDKSILKTQIINSQVANDCPRGSKVMGAVNEMSRSIFDTWGMPDGRRTLGDYTGVELLEEANNAKNNGQEMLIIGSFYEMMGQRCGNKTPRQCMDDTEADALLKKANINSMLNSLQSAKYPPKPRKRRRRRAA